MNSDSNVTILDVRSPAEYQEAHVSGAINLPLDNFEAELSKLKLDSGQRIVVYCKTGMRSGQALRYLQSRSYSNSINGISALGVADLTGRPIVKT